MRVVDGGFLVLGSEERGGDDDDQVPFRMGHSPIMPWIELLW